jgi:hypothetical protein
VLPDWFEALNRDSRYQLTPIGTPAPDLYIADEIENNRFRIAGGQPNGKVSWTVTGIRQDAYAKAHPMQVEVDKARKKVARPAQPNGRREGEGSCAGRTGPYGYLRLAVWRS